MATNNPTRVVTREVRLSYANIFEAKSIQGGKPKYNVSLIIPKSDTDTLNRIERAIDAAIDAGTAKFGGKAPTRPHSSSHCVTATSNATTKRMRTPCSSTPTVRPRPRLLTPICSRSLTRTRSTPGATLACMSPSMRSTRTVTGVSRVGWATSRSVVTVSRLVGTASVPMLTSGRSPLSPMTF